MVLPYKEAVEVVEGEQEGVTKEIEEKGREMKRLVMELGKLEGGAGVGGLAEGFDLEAFNK